MANYKNNSVDWWRGGVIYQIYPRSFADSNGDGVGDLPGITQRMDYLASLGVDAIWLSPFFKSPMKDFGYDVSDYRDVDPLFGTLADFDAMVTKAHALGLRVMIDQVLSHCSNQHPWFVESRANKTNPKADWFVWADAKADGTPPNNWLSIFGGSAWQWDTGRQQYFMHNFLSSQPDFNFHHPEVQQAMLDNLRFWLDRGVDGFRLDTANFFFHDPALRNNPPHNASAYNPSVDLANPYARQQHIYDKSRPENLVFLQRLRRLLNEYPGSTTVGEIGDDDTLARIAEYTSDNDKLHQAYGFDLLGPRSDARFVHEVIQRFQEIAPDGWACWSLSNHDVTRVATRWQRTGTAQDQAAWLRLIFAMQLCLRGSPCLYQGDELGLTEAELRFEDLQDPLGIEMWPTIKGRDGCRTPMVWDAALPHAGFSTAEQTWLPVAAEHVALAALDQAQSSQSLQQFYVRMLAWRRQFPVLCTGGMTLLAADDAVLAFVRRAEGAEGADLLCVFNFSAQSQSYDLVQALNQHMPITPVDSPFPTSKLDGTTLSLLPYAAFFGHISA